MAGRPLPDDSQSPHGRSAPACRLCAPVFCDQPPWGQAGWSRAAADDGRVYVPLFGRDNARESLTGVCRAVSPARGLCSPGCRRRLATWARSPDVQDLTGHDRLPPAAQAFKQVLHRAATLVKGGACRPRHPGRAWRVPTAPTARTPHRSAAGWSRCRRVPAATQAAVARHRAPGTHRTPASSGRE